MPDITIVDATFLTYLGQADARYGTKSLDSLYIPGTKVVITSTVYEEATSNLAYPKDRAVKAWIDAGRASGKIVYEPTPEYPAHTEGDPGELSMLHIANTKYQGQPVTFVSDDLDFYGLFNARNLQPNQVHYTGQQQLFESLLEGGSSTAEYIVNSNNHLAFSSKPPILKAGQVAYGSNGVVVDASDPLQIYVTASDGSVHTFSAFDRFQTDYQGNVQHLGTFDPVTGIFTPAGEIPAGEPPECFLAGTMIDMWDGSRQPIEEIRPDDRVVSYDEVGKLVPGRVTETFRNSVRHVLDFHTLMVTPGHVTLCGDGRFAGRHVPLIDILRSDGAVVKKDGTHVRATTNCEVGTDLDDFVWAVTGEKQLDGSVRVRDRGRIRLGTRVIVPSGQDLSVADIILGVNATFTADGLIKGAGFEEEAVPFLWSFSPMLPKPEDYVLQRSGLTLSEIYEAAEWESLRPQLPPPIDFGHQTRNIEIPRGWTPEPYFVASDRSQALATL